MYLFFSGEIGDIDGEEFRLLRNEIVASLHFITDREKEAELMKDDTYGSEIQSIGIISMILSPRFDVHKERRLIRFKEKNADIRLKIDYQKYQTADHQGKIVELMDLSYDGNTLFFYGLPENTCLEKIKDFIMKNI